MYTISPAKAALASSPSKATAQALTADIEDTLGADLPPLERLCRPRAEAPGCAARLQNRPDGQRSGDRPRPAVAAPITEAFASRRELIQQTFAAAQAAGELSDDADPAQLTVVMLAVVQAVTCWPGLQGPEQAFHQAIRGFLDLLPCHATNGLPEFAR